MEHAGGTGESTEAPRARCYHHTLHCSIHLECVLPWRSASCASNAIMRLVDPRTRFLHILARILANVNHSSGISRRKHVKTPRRRTTPRLLEPCRSSHSMSQAQPIPIRHLGSPFFLASKPYLRTPPILTAHAGEMMPAHCSIHAMRDTIVRDAPLIPRHAREQTLWLKVNGFCRNGS